ncbi:MBL fold metallo-hydrolase [Patescibacteria group bacterium]|nr:MAG: MBL fold metallo-hydrolase [Patescibacteria group bacterium]
MQISFFGAAREVTGSCNLLEAGKHKILIDCGMFQGSDFNEGKNSDPLPFNPAELSAVIVTHAHLDHTGRLPLLIKGGFDGYFYATPATVELTQLVLEDALEVMVYNNRKFGSPILYSQEDVAGVMGRFKAVEYGETMCLPLPRPPLIKGRGNVRLPLNKGEEQEGVGMTMYDAGHIFGSAFVEIEAEGKRVVFSGDIGNVDVPILKDTEPLMENIDALICESTYGNRLHESAAQRQDIIEKFVKEAIARGGTLMIPSFSLERTQELLYILNDLTDRKHKLPRVPIFLDSPLAIGATKVYRKYPRYYDEDAVKLFNEGDDLFEFPGLTMCDTKEESKRINQVPNPKIIIAGAGMMNGGRILHHALRYLTDEQSTLLIIGYQAQNTLGRQILDGKSPVRVMAENIPVRCSVQAIGALSAHADQEKLLDWMGGGKMLPKKVYLNHGEPEASDGLAARLKEDFGVKATVVNLGLSVKV